MTKEEIEKRIIELKIELAKLESERDSGIKPSETEALIKKYYGKCFSIEAYEYGSCEFMLETIHVDRENETLEICGHFIIYVTPDISFIKCEPLYPYGGTILAKGEIDISYLPDFPDWEDIQYEALDKLFESMLIDEKDFEAHYKAIDENADNFGWVSPLDAIIKDCDDGDDWQYGYIFGSL